MVILGIDPGIYGAMAIRDDLGKVEVHKMTIPKSREELNPSILKRLRELIEKDAKVLAYVERVNGMPSWGYRNFKFGKYFGLILGVLWGLDISVFLVSPITWQASIYGRVVKRIKRDKSLSDKARERIKQERYKARKSKNRQTAGELYPKLKYLLKSKNSDGLADALLIMEYGRRKLGLGQSIEIPDTVVDVSRADIFL